MIKKIKILLLTLFMTGIACSPGHPKVRCSNSLTPPVKSYVKIFSHIKIEECKKKEECPLGSFSSSGSGINIHLSNKTTTVLTAGHVCSSPVNFDNQCCVMYLRKRP